MPDVVPASPSSGRAIGTAGQSIGGSLGVDELWYLVLAAVLAAAGLVAILSVVYSAPVLLAEVALDAGLVSTVYRRLRKHEVRHWTGSVLRRTWLPATLLAVFMLLTGLTLQLAAPEARSIGGVFRAIGENP